MTKPTESPAECVQDMFHSYSRVSPRFLYFLYLFIFVR